MKLQEHEKQIIKGIVGLHKSKGRNLSPEFLAKIVSNIIGNTEIEKMSLIKKEVEKELKKYL